MPKTIYSDGKVARKRGNKRVLPKKYYTESIKNKRDWYRGWDSENIRIKRNKQKSKETNSDNRRIAETILRQIGGNRFVAMTGAKNFLIVRKGLQFDFPRSNGVNRCVIKLDSSDTYTMKFYYIHRKNGVPVATLKKKYILLYFDQLQDIFTEVTGLYLHL